jgi:hypothetical protein
MKLCELVSIGDDNVIGRLLSDARKNLTKLKDNKDREVCSLANGLISSIDSFEANPNILQTDGYSLQNYLTMLNNPSIGKRTLRQVSDALGSYSDDTGE